MTDIDRSFGRTAFGADPANYDAARPGYPDWVFDTLRNACGLAPGRAVFEIGAGTGKATRRLLELGADPLVAIEPDPRLAAFLRQACAAPGLTVHNLPFETADLPEAAFELGFAATSFHWLDEDAALAKVRRLLRRGGWWAAVWHVFGDSEREDPFHDATVDLFEGAPGSPSAGRGGVAYALDEPARLAALARAGLEARPPQLSRWELALNPDEVVALYGTYSNVEARADRAELLAALGRVARDRFGGRVIRNMITILYLARRG